MKEKYHDNMGNSLGFISHARDDWQVLSTKKCFTGYLDFSPNLFRKILFRFCLHTNFLFPQDELGQWDQYIYLSAGTEWTSSSTVQAGLV